MRLLRGLRAQILIWTILPLILILIAVSFGSIALHQNNMRMMVAERNTRLASVAASELSNSFDHHLAILQSIAARAAAAPRAILPPFDQSLLSGFDHGLGLFDAQGNLLAQSVSPAFDPQALSLARDALATVLSQPGKPVLTTLPGAGPALLITVADATGTVVVAGFSSADALHIPTLLAQLQTGPRAVSYILDANGRVLYSSDLSEAGHGLRAQIDLGQVQRGKGGAAFQIPAGGGDEHVVSYAALTLGDWGVVIDEPWEDVIVPVLQYTLFAPLLVLIAAVVSLAAVYFGLRRVIGPLQVLGHRSSRVAWGDFDAIRQPVGGIGEIGELQRTLQLMAEQIKHYQAGMQDYIAALTQGQEEERRRLARDLHDDTVQNLVALSQRVKMVELDLQDATAASPDPDKLRHAQARISELTTMAGQTLQSVRQIIRALRPVFLEELGLAPGLEMLVKGTQTEKMAVTFELIGEERRLAANQELAIYRLAQEALSNVTRHAEASEASVHLEFSAEGVTLTINDNGRGFVPPDTPADLAVRGHFGLMGMYERVSLLGGHLSIRSAPNQGAKVVAFVPG